MTQLDTLQVQKAVQASLEEDIGSGDITAALLPGDQMILAQIFCNDQAVICGIPWVNEVYRQIDVDVRLNWQVAEGDTVIPGQCLLKLQGLAQSILTGERSALNWLQTLSATATKVAEYLAELTGTQAKLLDTRKTIPGLRYAQKYAVSIAGGMNHRFGLFDAFLIKENHILSCGSIAAAIARARKLYPQQFLEIEVENLVELEQALHAKPDRILLDNFSLEDMIRAVHINNKRVPLEASGNINQATIHQIAQTGIDYISVGSITKHIRAIDLSLRVVV